jgi:hypothetical protein
MKKFLMAMVLCLVCTVSFGQISFSNSGSNRSENYLTKGTQGNIKITADGVYILNILDIESTNVLHIKLGNNKEETYQSLNTIISWFDNAQNKEFVEINVEDKIITLYKYAGSYIYFSDADGDYIKNYLQKAAMTSMFGGYQRKRVNDSFIGYITISQLRRAVENLMLQ